MLGFLFGFNARLGRLHFFLASVGLAVLMTAICFGIVTYLVQSTPRSAFSPEMLLKSWSVIAAIVFFGWSTFTLQSMRIRDIGWDPVCVIPAWIAIVIVDKLVAGRIPAWSLGHDHNGTVVGGLVNLVLLLALAFWPSGDHDNPSFDQTPPTPERSSSRRPAGPVAAERIARATGTNFGRRAF